jgi:hypothetical protein
MADTTMPEVRLRWLTRLRWPWLATACAGGLLGCGSPGAEPVGEDSESEGADVGSGPGSTGGTGTTSTATASETSETGTTGSSGGEVSSTSTGAADDDTGTGADSTSTDSTGSSGDESSTGGENFACVDEDIGDLVGLGVVAADFQGRDDDVTLTCAYGEPFVNAVDYVVRFTAPTDAVYTFGFASNTDHEVSIGLLDGDCDALQLACTQADWGSPMYGWGSGTHVTVALTEGQSVLVVMQSFDPALTPVLDIASVASGVDAGCIDTDLGSDLGTPVVSGDLTLADLDLPAPATLWCSEDVVADDVYQWVAPQTATYVVAAAAGTVLGVRPLGCAALAVLECATYPNVYGALANEGAMLSADLVVGQAVTIAVGAKSDAVASYDLDITANVTPGGTCCTASHASLGCSELDIQNCVCAVDGFCCSSNWDFFCANRARQFCDASCIGD